MNNNTIYMVIPCYNEEAVLAETTRRLTEKFDALIGQKQISPESRVVYVDDGSRDATWTLIEQFHRENPLFRGIKLSRNRGHQNALLAGLLTVKDEADAVISMDADLQDDIGAVDAMIEKFNQGTDIVYGVRSKRETDTIFKRATAEGFYRVMNGLGAKVVYNHADYRLMSRRALEALAEFGEVNLFLRGIVTLIGFKTDVVYYERSERFAGESKYPLRRMLSFAWDGITSFSVKPLQIIVGLGMVLCLASVAGLVYCLVRWLSGNTVTGWTSMTMLILLLGGVQLLSLGIIGQYIGKIYSETKRRPRFIIDTYLKDGQ